MPDGAINLGIGDVRGSAALFRLLREDDVETILDVGSGTGAHAELMRHLGRRVTTVDLAGPADHVGDFTAWCDGPKDFDAVWACHVLEHQPNPGIFLAACRDRLRPGGLFAVTVPPLKHAIVGGHVTLWNAGLLLYQLVLAGFDCRAARVGTYASGPGYPPYNVSVLVRRPVTPLVLPTLRMDRGDIETLAPYFPVPVAHGFDGRLTDVRW